MAIDFSAIIEFLPEFIISAIITGFVFQAITSEKLFISPRITKRRENRTIAAEEYEMTRNKSKYQNLLFNENMKILSAATLTASTWILLIYAMIGIYKSSVFMPVFGFRTTFMVYGMLIILFTIAMISSFSGVVRYRDAYRIAGSVLAVMAVVVFFELPAMKWFFFIYPLSIVIYIFIYFAALIVVFICYMLWWKMNPKNVFYLSFYSSTITYFFILALMLYKGIPKF